MESSTGVEGGGLSQRGADLQAEQQQSLGAWTLSHGRRGEGGGGGAAEFAWRKQDDKNIHASPPSWYSHIYRATLCETLLNESLL